MSNCEDSGTLELFRDEFLDDFFSYDIDVGSRLIKQDYLVIFEDSSNDAEKLFLANSKVSTVLSHFEVKTCFHLFTTYL